LNLGKVEDVQKLVTPNTFEVVIEDSTIIKSLYEKGTYELKEEDNLDLLNNKYYILTDKVDNVLVKYSKSSNSVSRIEKKYVSNIKPKNVEQTFAVNALLDEDIKVIALQGIAGTGKTLLALASALEQRNIYDRIVLARPIIPLSNRDIGFLPGDANEKISPYMQPLFDNLKFIKSQYKADSRKRKVLDDMEENGELEITALAFIRGRSLSNTIFIVDEAQNLTPHEVKTIVTRAGEGTKIIFTGDIAQIDTPYMDEDSNGLAYLVDKLEGENIFCHIKLEKGERSELANIANKLL
jgi:PhoH-like ATPase